MCLLCHDRHTGGKRNCHSKPKQPKKDKPYRLFIWDVESAIKSNHSCDATCMEMGKKCPLQSHDIVEKLLKNIR